jgi:hypothetical protein
MRVGRNHSQEDSRASRPNHRCPPPRQFSEHCPAILRRLWPTLPTENRERILNALSRIVAQHLRQPPNKSEVKHERPASLTSVSSSMSCHRPVSPSRCARPASPTFVFLVGFDRRGCTNRPNFLAFHRVRPTGSGRSPRPGFSKNFRNLEIFWRELGANYAI